MRVLLSTAIASQRAAHGGPIVARRQALALRRAGVEVVVAVPDAGSLERHEDLETLSYRASVPKPLHFPTHRPNPTAVESLIALVDRIRPDVVYDIHGPAWAVEAASVRRAPVVSMVGDYAWYCRRNFLVDASFNRCTGPESASKCFRCLNQHYSPKRRVVHIAVKQAAQLGIGLQPVMVSRLASFGLWSAVETSEAYASALRAKVDRFIVGDRKAEEFFLAHGVTAARIVRIEQCLPPVALEVRRVHSEGTPGSDRPLRIAFVGRPAKEKGLHVLARAFERLADNAKAELWIVHSEYATRDAVERHFEDLPRFRSMLETGRVKLFRPGSEEELFTLMATADVGVIPSIAFESPSLTMLEFTAQRVPIIRSQSGGMEHVIQDRVNGREFPCGDWRALRTVFEDVLANPQMLATWRASLPRIASDSTYAQSLIQVFEALAQ